MPGASIHAPTIYYRPTLPGCRLAGADASSRQDTATSLTSLPSLSKAHRVGPQRASRGRCSPRAFQQRSALYSSDIHISTSGASVFARQVMCTKSLTYIISVREAHLPIEAQPSDRKSGESAPRTRPIQTVATSRCAHIQTPSPR